MFLWHSALLKYKDKEPTMKKSSYLFERHYTNQQPSNLNKAKYEYWENMLGKDAMKRLMECKDNYRDYLSDDPYTINNGDETDKYNKILTTSISQMKTVNIEKGSVKNFVALVKNGSFLVRITDMTILIEKEFIYGSSKRPNPTDYYRKQHYQCG